jgi:hypothetical protein
MTNDASCVNCHVPLGDGPKRAPVHVDNGEGVSEQFCPRCFTYRRARMEPARFSSRRLAALLCSRCGWESADFGRGVCGQCGSRFVAALPPVPREPAQTPSAERNLTAAPDGLPLAERSTPAIE